MLEIQEATRVLGSHVNIVASMTEPAPPENITAETETVNSTATLNPNITGTTSGTSTTTVTGTSMASNAAVESSQNNLESTISVATLQKQIDEMKRKADSALVDTALSFLQLLISKPTALFDPYATLAALESLVDAAREKKDDRAKRFAVVLRQCRPLVNNPAMQSILMKLVADKEESEVAKVIDKAVRRQSGPANRG
ncbi:hypothetical protein QZH41_003367 [Actinostola sp. cb2023]|nr:hypothetical protein QZH41_003367 [Actinostola sp. cb2023]